MPAPEDDRARAMREAGTNEPIGWRYNEAFGRWMDRNPWARKIDKATRNHLLWVADHLPQIEAWRETLPASNRDQWNHPSTIKRQYERAMRVAEMKAKGETAPLSPYKLLQESLVESQEKVARLERQVKDGVGSLFDLHKDTVKNIADLIVRECTPSRVESLIRELRAAQKTRGAHAG
jgi:hypothetical protein